MLAGTVLGEVLLPPLKDLKDDVKISMAGAQAQTRRRAEAVCIGPFVNAVPPHPCTSSPVAAVGGVLKRAACKTPKIDLYRLACLENFVTQFVQKHYVPLSRENALDVETWLGKSTYPQWRREELEAEWRKLEDVQNLTKDRRNTRIGSFVKKEFYNDRAQKWARIINARADASKVVFGPYASAIESVVYETFIDEVGCAPFIKHVPVADRPKHIMELFAGVDGEIIATDYTSFEALFVRSVMQSVEFILYKHMLSKLEEGEIMYKLMQHVMLGINKCKFRNSIKVEISATRMSGEVTTSLGNGFSNLMFMLFTCKEVGSRCYGFVEGDDGLFKIVGVVPPKKAFKQLGLRIKLEKHNSVNTASFCGMIFDPDELVVICDPKKVLATTPWLDSKFAGARQSRLKALLRAKALSLVHQYPGMPVVEAYAHYLLRATRGQSLEWAEKTMRAARDWKFQTFHLQGVPLRRSIGPKTRQLMETKFGITVEYQVYLEKYFDGLTELQKLDSSIVTFVMPDEWIDNFTRFTFHAQPTSPFADPGNFPTNFGMRAQMLELLQTKISAGSKSLNLIRTG